MEQSVFIARLLGPVLFIAAVPMIMNPRALQEITGEFLKARALLYLTGIVVVLGGLGIVNSHNIWVLDWPVIITAFGWAMIIGGAARVVLPSSAVKSIGNSMLGKPVMSRVAGVAWACIGAYLSYQGYF